MSNRVIIFDTTLRDGEQSPGATMNLQEKLRMARQLESLGVDVIEAGFPASSVGDFEAVHAIANAVTDVQVAALARCNKNDIDRAWQALNGARNPRIHVFLATSPIHMEYKLKMTREQVVASIGEMVRYAKSLCEDIEFSAEDASRSDREFLAECCSAAVAAGGGYITAGARQVATVFFTDLLISLIRQVLLPLLYACIAAAAADAVVPGHSLQKIGQGLRKCAAWALTALMLVFTGFLSVTGAATSAADALSTQLTRTAIATAVPVVGSIISDAAGTVLAGAGMLKGTIGVFGLLAVLAICLTPFITMAVQYLLYKLAAFLAGTVTQEPLADLIDALGSAFGLMLGMTGSCALALLISIISSVSVVST